LIWQIYPQDDGAHHAKLEAFLDWLNAPASLRQFHRTWNGIANTGAARWPSAPELERLGRPVRALRASGCSRRTTWPPSCWALLEKNVKIQGLCRISAALGPTPAATAASAV
jgi:hypothetical protein